MEHTVPDGYLKLLGEFLVSYGLMEDAFRLLLTGLLNEDQRIGRVVTCELPFKVARALFVALYKEKIGEDKNFNTLKTFIKQAAELEQLRNQIVHSSICGDLENPEAALYISKEATKERRGFHSKSIEMTFIELQNVVRKVKKFDAEFHTFIDQLASKGKMRNPYA